MDVRHINRLSPALTVLVSLLAVLLFIFGTLFLTSSPAYAADWVFPVVGGGSFSDDYDHARSGGRLHEATDIIADKFTEVVAVESGTITWAPCPEPWYGYALKLDADSGYTYWYIHMNNDNLGTDDGAGGCDGAYASGIEVGTQVEAGQLLGWLGDSGNAEWGSSHLHFEMYRPDGSVMNPYETLLAGSIIDAGSIEPPTEYDNYIEPFGDIPLGTTVATGDVNGDGSPELVAGAGFGGTAQVRVFTEDGTTQSQFQAYDDDFTGGINVTTGDVDGDGTDEIIVAPREGGGPQVRVFNQDGEVLHQFMAYEESYTGGVSITSGDLEGIGKDRIITAPAGNRKAQVRIFNKNGKLLDKFRVYKKKYRAGVTVAVQDAELNTPSTSRIIIGSGVGKEAKVKVFKWKGKRVSTFKPYGKKMRDGVQVYSGDIHGEGGKQRIVTTPFSGNTAKVRIFTNRGKRIKKQHTFEDWADSGFSIANTGTTLYISHNSDQHQAAIRTIEL